MSDDWLPATQEGLVGAMEPTGGFGGEQDTKWVGDLRDPEGRGLPLSIEYTPDEKMDAGLVTVEDPNGIQFDIPFSAIPSGWFEDRSNDEKFLYHTDLNIMRDELKAIWGNAYQEAAAVSDMPTTSLIDEWEQVNFPGKVWPTSEGEYVPQQQSGTGWAPQVPRPRPASIRRKEDIPPEAGSGLGNWDEEWDEKRQRWVKQR